MKIKKSPFKIILYFLIFISSISTYSQETNPIIYGDIFGGMGGGREGFGFMSGAGVSYQLKDNLFSLRYTHHPQFGMDVVRTSPFTVLPVIYVANTHHEYAAMYGLREIYNGHSISLSAGISYNNYTSNLRDEENNRYSVDEGFVGLPFEFTIRWFKKERRRFHIYYVIPVGKPTAFGGSFGFKLVGNVSKNSFIGVGIVYGFGMYKTY